MTERHPQKISAIILAGGLGRRVQQQDKGLLRLDNTPLIELVIQRLQPQVDEIIISANRHLDIYKQLPYTVLSDEYQAYQGPLAGIASCLPHCRHPLLFVCPVDAPLLPTELVSRLAQSIEKDQTELAVAHDGERLQVLFHLMTRQPAERLAPLIASGQQRVMDWLQQSNHSVVDCSDWKAGFTNINTLENLAHLENKVR